MCEKKANSRNWIGIEVFCFGSKLFRQRVLAELDIVNKSSTMTTG